MLKLTWFFLLFSFLPKINLAQKASENEILVRKVADEIINETVLGFEGNDNQKFYKNLGRNPGKCTSKIRK